MDTAPEPEFEAALEELEQIVATLERGDAALAMSLAKYERGIRLVAHCHSLLDGAARTVALLSGVDEAGQPVTVPFDATPTADRERPDAPKPSKKRRASASTDDSDDIPF